MADASKEYTAFNTYEGLYQFKVLPLGFCDAPSTFQRLIECVLRLTGRYALFIHNYLMTLLSSQKRLRSTYNIYIWSFPV